MSEITDNLKYSLGSPQPQTMQNHTNFMNNQTATLPDFPQKIVLAGGSGFLGELLTSHFANKGWEVTILSRQPAKTAANAPNHHHPILHKPWDGYTQGDWTDTLEGAQALINLTGQSVNCRYNASNKRSLINSRIHPTMALAKAIEHCENPPEIWMNASTATIYKHTFGPPWDEHGTTGSHPNARDAFSVELAKKWETTFLNSPAPRTRKIILRSAMVLGHGDNPNDVFGVLRKLTRLGLGGKMSNGKQFVSWIHHTDFCNAIEWLIDQPYVDGIVNLTAPNPLPNVEMMRIFRQTFGMPIGLPASRWMLEAGAFFLRTETELILKSRRVIPGRLLQHGFSFTFPEMKAAVENLRIHSQKN